MNLTKFSEIVINLAILTFFIKSQLNTIYSRHFGTFQCIYEAFMTLYKGKLQLNYEKKRRVAPVQLFYGPTGSHQVSLRRVQDSAPAGTFCLALG